MFFKMFSPNHWKILVKEIFYSKVAGLTGREMGSLIINIYVLRQKPTLSSDAKESKYAVNSQKDIFQEIF